MCYVFLSDSRSLGHSLLGSNKEKIQSQLLLSSLYNEGFQCSNTRRYPAILESMHLSVFQYPSLVVESCGLTVVPLSVAVEHVSIELIAGIAASRARI